jgi:hypothetical protein
LVAQVHHLFYSFMLIINNSWITDACPGQPVDIRDDYVHFHVQFRKDRGSPSSGQVMHFDIP